MSDNRLSYVILSRLNKVVEESSMKLSSSEKDIYVAEMNKVSFRIFGEDLNSYLFIGVHMSLLISTNGHII